MPNNMKTEIEKIRSNWHKAAQELGFDFVSPYLFNENGKIEFECFGFVANYGSKTGTIILLACPPDFEINSKLNNTIRNKGYYCTNINTEIYAIYKSDLFIDSLVDWSYFGPENKKPNWIK